MLLYSVIALQIANLLYQSRVKPDLSATLFWNECGRRLLYRAANKTRDFLGTYAIGAAVSDLAALGGRPGRKAVGDGLDAFHVLLLHWDYFVPPQSSSES